MLKVKIKSSQDKLAELKHWSKIMQEKFAERQKDKPYRDMARNSVSFFEKLEKLLQLPIDKDKIRDQLKDIAGKTHGQYITAVQDLLRILDPSEAQRLFQNVFREDIVMAHDGALTYLTTAYLLGYEGLRDVVQMNLSLQPGTVTGYKRWRGQVYERAMADIPILIIGETGTSKRFMAKAIHEISDRRKNVYKELNCAALPETLIESELFGHVKGAFTGATKDKKGHLELSHSGTLVLDELGKMPLHLQAKLLKAIEEGRFYGIGGESPLETNVRFIGTIQPHNIDEQSILPDLLYRLGYPDVIIMPTLNERLQIEPEIVIGNSLEVLLKKMNIKDEISVTDEVVSLLRNYRYKGNYRELENILRGALISARVDKRNEITPQDLLLIPHRGDVAVITQPTNELKEIPLKDIILHAEKVKALIVTEKIEEILANGKNIKSALMAEGLSVLEYQNYWKKLKGITGVGVRALSSKKLHG